MSKSEPTNPAQVDDAADNDLLIKSRHLVLLRLGFACISLLWSGWLVMTDAVEQEPLGILRTAGVVVAYTIVFWLILRLRQAQTTFCLKLMNAVLITLDIVVLSALVHFTRGIESDLYFLYLLPTVLASHTFGRRGILITAIGSSFAYVATLCMRDYSLLPYLLGQNDQQGLAVAYCHRLWTRILTRSAMLVGVSVVWALFCEHMSTVAQQGATRLRGQLQANNELVSETKAQAAREHLINTIGSALISTLDIDRILTTTVSQLGSALAASRCAIITPAEQLNESPAIWEAPGTADQHEHETEFSRQFCDFILEHLGGYADLKDGGVQKTFVFENLLEEPLFGPIQAELKRLQLRSLLAQPIMYGGDSKGVILIGECVEQRRWGFSEMELTKAVAGQVAIAIEHARLVDQLSRKNRDLLQKNLHLDAKNLELRTMQSQLVHQEKMASLGRMVAGIAHELNNPVNFVHGNLPYLREYFDDMKTIIQAVDQLPVEFKGAVDDLKKKVKYEFLVVDLDNIIADLAEGAERIRQIIRNLRSFSRLDEAELKEASITEGIESTIKILNQYYGRDKIQAECSFADIPPVVCYPGKLNQVWMNLLSNAAQAVADVPEPFVSISTKLEDDWVIVSIRDNGAGIKSQEQSKIFEPFYTTKPVGQGTGLGLSICHSIIERHGGRIWFESEPGKGTTFKVKIPLKAEPEGADDSKQIAAVGRE